MIQTIKKSSFILLVAILLVGCKQKETLQTYIVDHQESPSFITVDIPTSIVNYKNANLSESEIEAYQSIEKLNFLGFKLDSTNKDVYNAEIAKLTKLLSDKKYIELSELNLQGAKMHVKYIGENDIAEEFIVFGSSKDFGFGVLRVLGKDMKPEKLFRLLETFNKAEVDDTQIKEIFNFFKP